MTTFELDLSKSDSFIDGIQEIFKPPSVESSTNVRITKGYMKSSYNLGQNSGSSKDINNIDDYDNKISNKTVNVSWKKPKSNAHEYCDSCGTFEGERLVCDRCPSSFHLVCLDPPIDMDEAPVGVWYCNRCTAIMKEEDKLSYDSGHSGDKGDTDTGINMPSNDSIGSSEITTEMLTEEVPSKKRKWSECDTTFKHVPTLQTLLDVVRCINPKEFELPKHLIPGIKLPFTLKTNTEMKTKSVISLENGIIPRPFVNCFECSRTCFYGTLIQCDYCPLYFHLDCLDPPLVQLPSRVERWMCPNHIEQVVDNSGIIKTIRLSERMSAYDEINRRISNIDKVDLLINFGLGHGFRFGSKMEEIVKDKPKIEVPDAVKRMYKVPLMAKSENEQCNNLGKSILNEKQKHVLQSILIASKSGADIYNTDALTLLHSTLDSISCLLKSKTINLPLECPPKASVTCRPGAEQVKSRAIFIPISIDQNTENSPPPIRMIYRNFDIGSSVDNDCVVTGCKYVSPRHASISYIDNHFCFELVNYSRYGTTVDDLLYYNDVSEKESHQSYQVNQNIKDIRAFIDFNGINSRLNSKTMVNSMHSQRDLDKTAEQCTCTEYGYTNHGLNNCTDRGWESTAPLNFGSVVRIGCQKFLFTAMIPGSAPEVGALSRASSVSSDTNDSKPYVKTNSSPKSDTEDRPPSTKVFNGRPMSLEGDAETEGRGPRG